MTEKRPNRTLGGNNDVFWNWCGKGELRIQRCPASDCKTSSMILVRTKPG